MCDYDIRRCFTCGKEFKPIRANQVTCSAECQYKRDRFTSNRSGRKRYWEIKEKNARKDKMIAELEGKIVEYADKLDVALQANQELAKKIKEIEKSIKADKKGQKGQAAPAIPNIKLEQCLRCNVKAMYLPCGKNVICWQKGVPCERCKDMKMPDFGLLGGSDVKDGLSSVPKDETTYTPQNNY